MHKRIITAIAAALIAAALISFLGPLGSSVFDGAGHTVAQAG